MSESNSERFHGSCREFSSGCRTDNFGEGRRGNGDNVPKKRDDRGGRYKNDNFWNGKEPSGPSNLKNKAKGKYGHTRTSSFKQEFLANISANLAADRGINEITADMPKKDEVLDEILKMEMEFKMDKDNYYRKMLRFRKKLPSYNMRENILKMVNDNQVIVISGETGCGKTTQIPQYILDQEILAGRGSTCHVVCTQPRRISAISVAERIADERSEKCGEGFSVGYQIRLEKKLPRSRGSILFCTTGILLQWMKSDKTLSCMSHIVIDEIHERGILSDFAITVLREVLPKRPDLKLILMSATLNAEHFSQYYDNCPCINIPGFTFPVQEYYLEDVLELTSEPIVDGTKPQGYQGHLQRSGENFSSVEQFKELIAFHIRQKEIRGTYSPSFLRSLAIHESGELNLDLIVDLTLHISTKQGDGSILIFLPGWSDISNLHHLFRQSRKFLPSQYKIIPLHSMVPSEKQREAFSRPPPGVRKIIISTSIAETSITIDDVVYVIDSGKIKTKNFDIEKNISTLDTEWVTLANARQRKGRAGRVQPGICYHLFSKAREVTLKEYPVPEMLRSRLEEVILQTKLLCLGNVCSFLEKVMDPPDLRVVKSSLRFLQTLDAIDSDENLTPLGYHLACLPLDPQTGKMILLGAIFSCVDPILSVAASLGFKDAFVIPWGKEKEVCEMKKSLAKGCNSDHLVLVEAMRLWESLDCEDEEESYQFCQDYYLSSHTLRQLRDMKKQFAEYLYEMNFLKSKDFKAEDANINSDDQDLLKAIISGGLYPNVANVSVEHYRKVHVRVETPEDGQVRIHPKSVNFKELHFDSPFLVYHLKLRSKAVYLHDTTVAHPLPLLFFGERPEQWRISESYEYVSIESTIKFNCKKTTSDLIKKLRGSFDDLLSNKLEHPGATDWSSDSEGKTLRDIVALITQKNLRGSQSDY